MRIEVDDGIGSQGPLNATGLWKRRGSEFSRVFSQTVFTERLLHTGSCSRVLKQDGATAWFKSPPYPLVEFPVLLPINRAWNINTNIYI